MTNEEAWMILGQYDLNFHWDNGEKIPAADVMEAFDLATEALEDIDAFRKDAEKEKIFIVSFYDREAHEPVVSAFDNQDAARSCYEHFKYQHEVTAIDEVKVYKEFKIFNNDKGGRDHGI